MPYQNAVDIPAITTDKPNTKLTEGMEADGQWVAEAANWFVKNFLPGEGDLYQRLVEPLTGDFNRIAANAQGWEKVQQSLRDVSENLKGNERKLTGQFWKGEAAESFKTNVDDVWRVALVMAADLAGFMQTGFKKLSDALQKLGQAAVKLALKAHGLIERLASRLIPGYGWFAIAWDVFVHGEFPLIDDARAIVGIIERIESLHKSITEVATIFRQYLQAVDQIIGAFKKLPQMESGADAIAMVSEIAEAHRDISSMEMRTAEKGESAPMNGREREWKRYKESLNEMKETVEGALGSSDDSGKRRRR